MRHGLTRGIIRDQSSYKLARHIIDGFLLAELAVMVIAVVWVCIEQSHQPEPSVWYIAAVCCGAVVVTASAILQRELLHGVFDIADCALLNRSQQSTSENPFRA